MFRDRHRAIELVRALHAMTRGRPTAVELIVVDDGSADGSFEAVSAAVGDLARVVCLAVNSGRSAARNAGARLADYDRILFLDCDCLPGCAGLIECHLQHWDESVVATTGPVVGDGVGFWHLYQAIASERRRRQHIAGLAYSGSSQNLMVSREAFMSCGGFDTEYRGYGFEDRDLQIRLAQQGSIRWCEKACVRHMDRLSLSAVSRKMIEAGGQAADIFRFRHPEAYRRLGYAALDAHLHPWLRLPARLAALMLPGSARLVDGLLHRRWLPFAFKALLVRSISAASYLAGCRPR